MLLQIKSEPAGGLTYTEEAGEGAMIDAMALDNIPFKKPPLFSSGNCVLILNKDKQATATSSTGPKAESDTRWLGLQWKEITFK